MNEQTISSKTMYTQLDSDHQADFEHVKGYYGIKNNSEMLRFLIRQEARRLTAAATLAGPAIDDVVAAYLAQQITAEEAMTALAAQGDLIAA